MSGVDLLALLPLIVVTIACCTALVTVAFLRDARVFLGITLAGLGLAFASLTVAGALGAREVTALFVIDGYALFYMGLMLAAGFAVALLSYGYLERRAGNRQELYILLLLATLGAMALASANHFASFFLSLELLSVALFTLLAYPRHYRQPLEASIKYLILSGVSSAFLLFGMALIYAKLGHLQFAAIGAALSGYGSLGDVTVLAGSALIITGVGFKLSVVPFHMWTPDVYEGAPAPVAGFLATVSKGAIFALLLRYFHTAAGYNEGPVLLALAVIAIASMFVGNLLALLQNNVKRILAYSSIAHLGYLLVAFLAGGALAVEAVSYYLIAYFVTTIAAFGIVTLHSPFDAPTDDDRIDNYKGLFWERPWLAAAFTLVLLSLAGIPLTGGFVAKFYAIAAGVNATLWTLVVVLVITSVIGLFYYLRIVVALYTPAQGPTASAPPLPLTGSLTLSALIALLVWLGVYPAPFIELIRALAVPLS